MITFQCNNSAKLICYLFFQICIRGDEGKSTCYGDSGSPGMKVQEGIVSYGEPICPRGYPVVFTLLQSYLDWIVENIPELD